MTMGGGSRRRRMLSYLVLRQCAAATGCQRAISAVGLPALVVHCRAATSGRELALDSGEFSDVVSSGALLLPSRGFLRPCLPRPCFPRPCFRRIRARSPALKAH